MSISLTDSVAVVTGASSGIGRALALALAPKVASLWLVARRPDMLESVARSARDLGTDAKSFPVDLAIDEDIRRLARAISQSGGVDVLVHCAGVTSLGPVSSHPVDTLDWQYRINLRAPFLLTQSLLPGVQSRQGQIVFVNSSAGLSTRANVAQYAATKHGLKALADSLRQEVNADGVRVLTVYPGRTATPHQEMVCQFEGRPYIPEHLIQPEDIAAAVIAALCLPRTAEVTDIQIRPMQKLPP